MRVRLLLASLGAVVCMVWSSPSRAACTKDNDCPGDAICEAEQCVAAPAKALPPPPPTPAQAVAAPAPQPALDNAEPIDEDPRARKARRKREKEERNRRRGKHHSTAMMVGGIVITSFAPIGLLVGGVGALTGQPGLFVGGFAATGVLCGVGIPLIVIGGRREHPQPAVTARLTPWITPQGGGLGLRFEL